MVKHIIKAAPCIVLTIVFCFCSLNIVCCCAERNICDEYDACGTTDEISERIFDPPTPVTAIQIHHICKTLSERPLLSVQLPNDIISTIKYGFYIYSTPFERLGDIDRQVILKQNE